LACDDGRDGDSAVLFYSAQNNIRGVKSRKIRCVAWVRIIKKKFCLEEGRKGTFLET
jgi:hypothetical protein